MPAWPHFPVPTYATIQVSQKEDLLRKPPFGELPHRCLTVELAIMACLSKLQL
jgi:hypothetical protein